MQDLFTDNVTVKEMTVSEVSKNIKKLIESNFQYLKIKGEITGLKNSNAGHVYFSLKEKDAIISVVCFRGTLDFVPFELEEGLSVVVTGRITTYPGRSSYQILAEGIKKDGIGDIIQEIENRKSKLAKEGLFDADRKKTIPKFPKSIGIITSPVGAAIQDIMSRLEKRLATKILLFPVTVQGENSPKEICKAIEFFNKSTDIKPDVLVVTRGGGSFEDLIGFNDEELVRAVANSEIPIVSAVGHEIDTALIDYVSDLALPTPTAVGEVLLPLRSELNEKIRQNYLKSNQFLNYILQNNSENLTHLFKRLRSPIEQINSKNLMLNHLVKNLDYLIRLNCQKRLQSINFAENKLENLNNILQISLKNYWLLKCRNLENCAKLLTSYSHKNILKKGYSIARTSDGKIVKDANEISVGEVLDIELAKGKIKVKVLENKEGK
jgi:exodeoxyribonuclease VII large subunit